MRISRPLRLSQIYPLIHSGLALLLVNACLCGCASLPKSRPEWREGQKVDTANTTWARNMGSAAKEHPGESGIELLPYGFDALSARLALADTAERTLDLQYYMWVPDASGRLLTERVLRAADRGVRVRMLMDDIGGSASDEVLLALSTHTNIEVRLFNPIANRTFRGLSSLFDFRLITRRMHNKSFTVDGSVTILGGRNISDRYFAVGDEPRFADFEALAAGPAAKDVTTMFERFWYNPSAIPIQALTRKRLSPAHLADLRNTLAAKLGVITNSVEFTPLAGNEMRNQIRRHELSLVWGPAQLVGDQPEKVTTDPEDASTHMLPEVRHLAESTKRELLLVSPYFIPGDTGVAFLRALCERGIRVLVLSSSLAANDVTAVHVGYRRYRKALLRAGVELWEMKPDVHVRGSAREREPASGRSRKNQPHSSLHTKAFTFDRQILFVGSLNLDPRSAALNTEMGLVIKIPKLADAATDLLEEKLAQNAYRLEFVSQGKNCGHIVWISQENGKEVRYSHEPHATVWQRLTVFFLSWLPIESQL